MIRILNLILVFATMTLSIAMSVRNWQCQPQQDVYNLTKDTNYSDGDNSSPCRERRDIENTEEDCPTWMYHTNSSNKCTCGVDNHHTVKCDQSVDQVYILDSYRMTYDKSNREVIVGASLYGMFTPNDNYETYHLVPMNKSQLNEAMCGRYNRKGRLCGECKEGYSPLVYSYDIHCRKCTETESKHNIIKYVGVAFVPLTLFYFLVVLLKLNANSPSLHGFILCAQLVSAPFVVRVVFNNPYNYMTMAVWLW